MTHWTDEETEAKGLKEFIIHAEPTSGCPGLNLELWLPRPHLDRCASSGLQAGPAPLAGLTPTGSLSAPPARGRIYVAGIQGISGESTSGNNAT